MEVVKSGGWDSGYILKVEGKEWEREVMLYVCLFYTLLCFTLGVLQIF